MTALSSRCGRWLAAALVVGLLAPAARAGGQPPRPGETGPGAEIIGGVPADPGEYPFMVALLRRGVTDRFEAQFCGGSLISPDTVLTAAHCLDGWRASAIDVLVGTNTLAGGGGGTRVPVRRLRVHPGFNSFTYGNDLGIIQLGTELPDAPVATVQPGQGGLWPPGTMATVMGWGNLSPAGNHFPLLLHEVDLPILPNPQCGDLYGSIFIDAKMLCAGDVADGGEDSCQGDSGGPLIVRDGPDPVQVGIVSWGIGCAQREYPGVYTRLAQYSAFVNPYLDPDTAPNRVERVRGERVTPTSFKITWRAPVFDGGTRITQYRVAIPALSRNHPVPAGQTWLRLRNLPPGRHLVQVTATNAVGTSAPRTVAINV